MKSKQQKYDEAVARNVQNNLGTLNKKTNLDGKPLITSLERAKHALGIRDSDKRYDAQITKTMNFKNGDKNAAEQSTQKGI